MYIAMANNYFAESDIDVKVMTVDGGSTHTNAVLTGQAFAFIGGPRTQRLCQDQGRKLRAVVNVVDRGNVYYSARKGAGARRPGVAWPDAYKGGGGGTLRGRATGLAGGTPNSITPRYLLKKWNLDAGTTSR